MSSRVGILGFQGCIEPHENAFESLGIETYRVTSPEHFTKIDRLILPGGESSTMLRFVKQYSMALPIKEFAKHHPTWGICAGAILLASDVYNPVQEGLGILPIDAHRNFYGSQSESFATTLQVDILNAPLPAQFIRAPRLSHKPQQADRSIKIHAYFEEYPVFFSAQHVWATSFHCELQEPYPLHEAFLRIS